jgi:hypothetical protein
MSLNPLTEAGIIFVHGTKGVKRDILSNGVLLMAVILQVMWMEVVMMAPEHGLKIRHGNSSLNSD